MLHERAKLCQAFLCSIIGAVEPKSFRTKLDFGSKAWQFDVIRYNEAREPRHSEITYAMYSARVSIPEFTDEDARLSWAASHSEKVVQGLYVESQVMRLSSYHMVKPMGYLLQRVTRIDLYVRTSRRDQKSDPTMSKPMGLA